MTDQDLTEAMERKGVRRSARTDGVRLVAFLKCLALRQGHDYVNSKSRPGYLTCVRCRFRRRISM